MKSINYAAWCRAYGTAATFRIASYTHSLLTSEEREADVPQLTHTAENSMPKDIIQMAEEHNEFITLEDGYVHYAPTLQGALSAVQLRLLADELDRRNAAWDAQVQSDPSIGAEPSLKMSASTEDYPLLLKLASRAVNELGDYGKLEALMDLTATHLNGCKLDLEGLLHAPVVHFVHDIAGIRARLDRDTGKLPADWTPRFCVERT